MDIHVSSGAPLELKTPCLIIGIHESHRPSLAMLELDSHLAGAITRAFRDREFRAKAGEKLLLHPPALPAERLLLLGLGPTDKGGVNLRRELAGAAAFLQERGLRACALDLSSLPARRLTLGELAQLAGEAVILAGYRFVRYRSPDREHPAPSPLKLTLRVPRRDQVKEARAGAAVAEAICRGVILARDLVNEPGNVKSPEELARRARELAEETGLRCSVLDRRELEKEGFGALLGVAQGSVREPRLIILEYRGAEEEQRPIALIGKGVVFDAGGISLKPAERMDEMKMDMAGGAAVFGTLSAAARLKLPVNLVGLVPAVENLPSGSAIRPGDILTSLSGKTIEVLNTDAEGRMILADTLTYAKRFAPRAVIDIATLTGACIVALGHEASAVLGNHEGLARALRNAGERCGERLWQLPLWDEHAKLLKSEVADLKNTAGRPAGTITAAAFLRAFAEDFSWAHLDIAGTAWEEKGTPGRPQGGTGVGVRLLIQYLRDGLRPATNQKPLKPKSE